MKYAAAGKTEFVPAHVYIKIKIKLNIKFRIGKFIYEYTALSL